MFILVGFLKHGQTVCEDVSVLKWNIFLLNFDLKSKSDKQERKQILNLAHLDFARQYTWKYIK